MKSCPSCHSNYTDDSLIYCLQDGAELIAGPVSETEFPTVAFGEKAESYTTNKDVNQIRVDLPQNDRTAWNQSRETQIASVQAPDRKSNTLVVALSSALRMLVLFGGVGIGGWFYFSKNQSAISSDSNRNSNAEDAAKPNRKSTNESSANEKSSTKTTPSVAPTPTFNIEEAKAEVSKNINAWKSASESHDLGGHMDYYAERVDYYNKSRVSKSLVRSDRLNAYEKYPIIKITLSNMNITHDSLGENLTAVFDKEWLFQNDQKQSTGKVKSQLKFSKINELWKITSEKDLKVYFVK